MTLAKYKAKRHFNITSEPAGKIKRTPKKRIFVIQKHAARRLHYDFRLEHEGVLKSWAVPKGPDKDPKIKRLAVEVEDHPIEYAKFKGTIPKGEYGAGKVEIWDEGFWEPEGDVNQALKKGKLVFTLHGKKLKGCWALVRIADAKDARQIHWLLFKHAESNAALPTQATITKKKANFPTHLKPELATLVESTPDDDRWLHEVKFDGYRIITELRNGNIKLMTRNNVDWTKKIPSITAALRELSLKEAIFDGELVVLDENGRSDFQLLQNVLKLSDSKSLIYYIFDLLYLNGHALFEQPLIERKKLLAQVLKTAQDPLRYVEHVVGSGKALFHNACDLGLEGIISKKMNSSYVQQRTKEWVKSKCVHEQEFVIGGYTDPQGQRRYFGSLLVGYYDQHKQFIYCGHVGTGFNSQLLEDIYKKLHHHEQTQAPFTNRLTNEEKKGAHWIKPVLIAQIRFHSWTSDNRLRIPVFQGLREDKMPKSVTKELPASLSNNDHNKTPAKIHLTHPNKILYPALKLTKQDIVTLYESLGKWILPHIINRPLSILRCPQGAGSPCFYQKHCNEMQSDNIQCVMIKEKDKESPYIMIKDMNGLFELIQNGVLEIHPWGCSSDNIEKPDRLVFDLDPETNMDWKDVITAAKRLRNLLMDVGLKSFVKTTGGKGLHIVVPFTRKFTWDELKSFSEIIATYLTELYPKNYTVNMLKSARRGKIFIDYLRNGRGATAVAAYSLRAKPEATIATPITWEELEKTKNAATYTAKNILKRLSSITDPWEDFFKIRQTISLATLKKISKLVNSKK